MDIISSFQRQKEIFLVADLGLVWSGLIWSSVVWSGLVGISNKHSWNESVGMVANKAIHGITSGVHQSLIFFSFGVFILNFEF